MADQKMKMNPSGDDDADQDLSSDSKSSAMSDALARAKRMKEIASNFIASTGDQNVSKTLAGMKQEGGQ